MDNKMVICVRDKSVSPVKIILESRGENSQEVADYFAMKLFELDMPGDIENLDIYIGWWGNQDCFVLSTAFLQLLASTGLDVTFDIND